MSAIYRYLSSSVGSDALAAGPDLGLYDLQKRKAWLEGTAAEEGTDVGGEVVLLALILVNTAMSNRQLPFSVAIRAADTALSVVSTFRDLIPDINNLTELDSKYVNALSANVGTIRRQLYDAHQSFIKLLASSTPPSASQLRHWETQLTRAHEAFLQRASHFMIDSDLASRRAKRSKPEYTDAHVVDLGHIKLGERFDGQPGLQDVFWTQTYRAVVKGRGTLVKKYHPGDFKVFQRDLETLRTHRHAHLPALFAHSKPGASAAFIAVSIEVPMPLREYVSTICKTTPNLALGEAWRMFTTLRYTAEYLLDSGVCYCDLDLMDILETAVTDASGHVILAPSITHALSGQEGRIKSSEISTLIPIFDFGFFGREPRQDDNMRGSINRHNTNIRPLEYALRTNPEGVLRRAFGDLMDLPSQKLALARWRPRAGSLTPDRMRRWDNTLSQRLTWNIAQPTVGDLGKYSYSPDGTLEFVTLTNVRKQLGGCELAIAAGDQDSNNLWRVHSKALQWETTLWKRRIHPGIALDYLCTHGRQLGVDYGMNPEDLILVTEVGFDLMENSYDEYPFLFGQFSQQGCLLASYWSTSGIPRPDVGQIHAIDPPTEYRMVNPIDEIRMNVHVIQVEGDEIQGVDHSHPPVLFATAASLGDIGYHVHDSDRREVLHVVHNPVSDSGSFKVKPLEGNDCVVADDALWQSPLIKIDGISTICYSWMVSSPSLPGDLNAVYLHHFLISEPGCPRAAIVRAGLVKAVTYYLQVTLPFEPIGASQVRLSVSFCQNTGPTQVFWSTHDSSVQQVLPLTSWSTLTYPEFAYSEWRGPEFCTSTSSVDNRPLIQRSQLRRTLVGQRIGDVGYWARDARGFLTDHWVEITHVELPPTLRELDHSVSQPGQTPCNRLSDTFWRSEAFDTSRVSHQVDYCWTETFGPDSLVHLYCTLRDLANSHGIPQSDILIVTRVASHVVGTATPQYVTWFHAAIGSSRARIYVLFPPDGGCFAYWSTVEHTAVDSGILSTIDLNACNVIPGLMAQVSVDVQRNSLEDLSDLVMRPPGGYPFSF